MVIFAIFIVIAIIQAVLIAGVTFRIMEVAARFTLNGLPGKQIAVEAECGSGAMDFSPCSRQFFCLLP
jgi:flagellar biosynthesis protein FlhA